MSVTRAEDRPGRSHVPPTHEAPHSTTLGAPTLHGSDVEWAQQFRPDRKGQTDG